MKPTNKLRPLQNLEIRSRFQEQELGKTKARCATPMRLEDEPLRGGSIVRIDKAQTAAVWLQVPNKGRWI